MAALTIGATSLEGQALPNVPTPALSKIPTAHTDALASIHQRYHYITDLHALLSLINSNKCLLPPGITYKHIQKAVSAGWKCAACQEAKMRHTATAKSSKFVSPHANPNPDELELHIDISGPFNIEQTVMSDEEKLALDNKEYMLVIVERDSRAVFPIPIAHKWEADRNIQVCVALIRAISGKRVAIIRTDGGGEFTSKRLAEWLATHSIHHNLSIPHESNMNATVERWIYIVTATARSCMLHAFLTAPYWPWAVRYAGMLLLYKHRSKATKEQTPISLLAPTHIPVKWMDIVFGEQVSIRIPEADRASKMGAVAEQGIFLGVDFHYQFAPVVLIPSYGRSNPRIERAINLVRHHRYYYTSWDDQGVRTEAPISSSEPKLEVDSLLQQMSTDAIDPHGAATTTLNEEGVNKTMTQPDPDSSFSASAPTDRRLLSQRHIPPVVGQDGKPKWEFRRILKKRTTSRGGNEYLVEWSGTDKQGRTWEPTWEPTAHVPRSAIKHFDQRAGRVNYTRNPSHGSTATPVSTVPSGAIVPHSAQKRPRSPHEDDAAPKRPAYALATLQLRGDEAERTTYSLATLQPRGDEAERPPYALATLPLRGDKDYGAADITSQQPRSPTTSARCRGAGHDDTSSSLPARDGQHISEHNLYIALLHTANGIQSSFAVSTTDLEDEDNATRERHRMWSTLQVNHITVAMRRVLNHPDSVPPNHLQAVVNAVLKGEDGSRRVVIEPKNMQEFDAIEDLVIKHGLMTANEKEYASHITNRTWTLVPVSSLPPGVRPIGCKWVWKIKVGSTGEIEKYKARLTARGDQQKEGVDYHETFAATVKCVTLKMALLYAAKADCEIFTIDYVTAFLNAFVKEPIYMEQPPMFKVLPESGSTKWGDRLVCLLNRALYGIKQAPREWNHTVDKMMRQLGFKPLIADQCLYQKRSKTGKLIMASLYVDDTMVVVHRDDINEWNEIKEKISNTFPIEDIGECQWILRMAIKRDRKRRVLWLSQEQSIHELITTHQDLINKHYRNKTVINPAGIESLTADGGETEASRQPLNAEELKTFQSLVGSCIYLGACTRPDIAFQTNRLATFMACARQQHLDAIIRVCAYLRDTSTKALCFYATEDEMQRDETQPLTVQLITYCDSDFASCTTTRRSTTGCMLLFNGIPFHWISRRQKTVSLSSAEAEWMALCDAAKEALWALSVVRETNENVPSSMVESTPPITARVDNSAALTIVNADSSNTKTKHVDVRHHFVKDLIKAGTMKTEWVSTSQQLADILTKRLPTPEFTRYVKQILAHNNESMPDPIEASSVNGTNTPTVTPKAATVNCIYSAMLPITLPLPMKAMGCV